MSHKPVRGGRNYEIYFYDATRPTPPPGSTTPTNQGRLHRLPDSPLRLPGLTEHPGRGPDQQPPGRQQIGRDLGVLVTLATVQVMLAVVHEPDPKPYIS